MPKILLLVNAEDTYFLSHRLPTALAAQDAGFTVHVLARNSGKKMEIESMGFIFHNRVVARGNRNLFTFLRTIIQCRNIVRQINPAAIYVVGLEQIVTVALACFENKKTKILNAVNGLGFAFTSSSKRAKVTKLIIVVALKIFAKNKRSIFIFQNKFDRATLVKFGIANSNHPIIPGSGVDTTAFPPTSLPEPSSPLILGMACRMVETKGVRNMLTAMNLLAQSHPKIKLRLAGVPDPGNPESINEAELLRLTSCQNIEWLGQVDNMFRFWTDCHIAISTSHREGMPMSLLQAASIGRPIIATDVPGNNDICSHGVNGFLVPIDEAEDLAAAISNFVTNPDLVQSMGAASIKRVLDRGFSADSIKRNFATLCSKYL